MVVSPEIENFVQWTLIRTLLNSFLFIAKIILSTVWLIMKIIVQLFPKRILLMICFVLKLESPYSFHSPSPRIILISYGLVVCFFFDRPHCFGGVGRGDCWVFFFRGCSSNGGKLFQINLSLFFKHYWFECFSMCICHSAWWNFSGTQSLQKRCYHPNCSSMTNVFVGLFFWREKNHWDWTDGRVVDWFAVVQWGVMSEVRESNPRQFNETDYFDNWTSAKIHWYHYFYRAAW